MCEVKCSISPLSFCDGVASSRLRINTTTYLLSFKGLESSKTLFEEMAERNDYVVSSF
jgi:hypothetical protein